VTVLIIILAVCALIVLWVIVTRNSFIRARNKVDESWSGVDVQLKRRHDLVPNLVETVRGYAAHEEKVLTEVTRARAEAMGATSQPERIAGEAHLSQALGGLRVVAEQYPQLRAAEPFLQLQRELSDLEEDISASRRIYNDNVESYNTRVQTFPNSIVAAGGFPAREFFQLDSPAERQAPAVTFS
jgi:LemA protein